MMLYDQSDKPLPNAYRSMRRLDVRVALKKAKTLTAKEHNCLVMYFDVQHYGVLSQSEIAQKMDMLRPAVQRAMSNGIIKLEKEGLL